MPCLLALLFMLCRFDVVGGALLLLEYFMSAEAKYALVAAEDTVRP
jgi:hypothetical protein